MQGISCIVTELVKFLCQLIEHSAEAEAGKAKALSLASLCSLCSLRVIALAEYSQFRSLPCQPWARCHCSLFALAMVITEACNGHHNKKKSMINPVGCHDFRSIMTSYRIFIVITITCHSDKKELF